MYNELLIESGLQIDKFKAKGAMKEIAIAKASCICYVGMFLTSYPVCGSVHGLASGRPYYASIRC
jgi:hypothetical protein